MEGSMEAGASSSSTPPLPVRALRAVRARRKRRLEYLPQSMAATTLLMGCVAALAMSGTFEGWKSADPARAKADLRRSLSYVPGVGDSGAFASEQEELNRRQLSDIVAWTPYGYVNLSNIECEVKGNSSSTFPSLGDSFENDSKAGATIFIIVITLYMFLGLAIVCDSFFESSLSAICEAMNLKDDVAGATWMAAGGSAPELATSIIGVFISNSDIGFGTIVGSAVFNVLFVIACCAFVAPNLKLTWWPLARDCSYYCFALAMIVIFVSDLKVEHYEAAILLLMYVGYVAEMYFNEALEVWVTKRVKLSQDESLKNALQKILKKVIEHPVFLVVLYSTIIANSIFVILEIMEFNDRAAQLPCMCGFNLGADALAPTTYFYFNLGFNIFFICEMLIKFYTYGFFGYWKIPVNAFDGSLVFLIIIELILTEQARGDPSTGDPTQEANDAIGVGVARMLRLLKFVRALRAFRAFRMFAPIMRMLGMESVSKTAPTDEDEGAKTRTATTPSDEKPAKEEEKPEEEEDDDDDDEPFNPFEAWGDLSSLAGICGRFFWLVGLPLSLLFFLTIPDCRRPMFAKAWLGTFGMCIFWIGGLSCIMVWMVERFGIMYGIPELIMGLFVLVVGTLIPDCLSSVAVARRGHGDMAVSSSIGSNIFDVLIGLPIPWFLYTAILRPAIGESYGLPYVAVNSEALAVMILMLFVMVALVITTIHLSGWVLSVKLGGGMMALYFVFLIISLLLDRGFIFGDCSVVDPLIGG
jgi:K+-dependent Na+/Ca+ exchanger-like protein